MDAITNNLDLLWSGFLKTVGICLWSALGALALGTVLAACRVCPVPPLRAFGTGYVGVLRNCPLTVVLFFIAFGFPEIGVNGSYYVFAVCGLVVYTAAFVCEALRAGVNAVPVGQAEAARALGLSFGQVLREVVMPQAFRSCVAPLGSVLIAMFKNSAVVGAFGVAGELFQAGLELTGAKGYAAMPSLTGVALFYLLLTLPSGALLHVLERKTAIQR